MLPTTIEVRYRIEVEQPQSLFAFLDVLGFSESVLDAYRDARAPTLLHNFREAIRLTDKRALQMKFDDDGESDSESSGWPPWKWRIFSDSLMIWIDNSTHVEAQLGDLFLAVTSVQIEMMRHGFMIRGGIAAGETIVDDSFIFGDAIVYAHQAESKTAKYPRVVLHPTITKWLGVFDSYYSHPHDAPHNKDLLVDADGEVFVNYLYALRYDDNEPGAVDFDLVEHHKALIENNLRASVGKQYADKYQWSARYHNFFCMNDPDLGADNCIAGVDAPTIQRRTPTSSMAERAAALRPPASSSQ